VGGQLVAGGEETEDVESVLTMAPGATITVFGGLYPEDYGLDGIYEAIVESEAANGLGPIPTITTSYNNSNAHAEREPLVNQMALQGQTFVYASGDIGLWDPSPGGSLTDIEQAITLVGGTELSLGPNSTYGQEWPWVTGTSPDAGQATSGGVISQSEPIPWYQWGAALVSTQYGGSASLVYRNFPDVAFLASSLGGWQNGANHGMGGTSSAAPLFAGLVALANAQLQGSGRPTLGFLNPLLYGLASTAYYYDFFHDITTSNGNYCGKAACPAPGYDLATGLGSPGPYLLEYLSGGAWTFSVQSMTGVPGTITSFALTKGTPSTDIAWAINNVPWTTGSPDNEIWYLNSSGWHQGQGGAIQVVVDPVTGYPWVANTGGTVFYSSNGGGGWNTVTAGAPSGGLTRIAMGTPYGGQWGSNNGGSVVWAIGATANNIWVYNDVARPSQWLEWGAPSSLMVGVAVAPDTGQPFAIDLGGTVWVDQIEDGHSIWTKVTDAVDAGTTTGYPGVAYSLAIGPKNQAWVINSQPWESGSPDHKIFMLANFNSLSDEAWSQQPGGAVTVGVAADGTPWLINHGGTVFVGGVGWGQTLKGGLEELGLDAGWPGWNY
jgi:subtilase family serine protease